MIKALFLDRDGVINKDTGYVYKKEDFIFKDGIFELCKYVQKKGLKIFIVTNQSGISRGYFSEQELIALNTWLLNKFIEHDIKIEEIAYCPELDNKAPCRKPNPGMFIKLIEKHNIDRDNSIAIGDKETDLLAAHRAGIRKLFFIKTHYSEPKNLKEFMTFTSLYSLLDHLKKTD